MPDVIDVEANVLGNGLVFDDFSGAWVPFVDAGDKLRLLQLDDVIRFMGMLDDRRLVILPLLATGFLFAESGTKISTKFSNIHFATFARNLVYTRS